MGQLINDIQIVMSDELPDIEKYDSQLKTLILSAEGTIPGSRGFGLSYDFISHNPREAANMLALELEEKVEEYIPEIRVTGVKVIQSMDGNMSVQVNAEGRYEDGLD